MKKPSRTIATILLWLIFAGLAVWLLFTFTQANDLIIKPLVIDQQPQQADVIIILGGGVVNDLKIVPWAVQERIAKGVALYRDGLASKIIITGGKVQGRTYAETDIMLPYLTERKNVPRSDIYIENQARSTRENALYSQHIMEEQGWQTALLVTSAYHTRRACNTFQKLDMAVTCVAAYESQGFRSNAFRNMMDFQSIVREYVATVYYWLRGFI